VTTRVVPLRRQISNAFLLLGERPVLVDAGAPGDTEPLLEQLRGHGVTPDELALLVLTHATRTTPAPRRPSPPPVSRWRSAPRTPTCSPLASSTNLP